RISFLAHPCSTYFEDYIDIDAIIDLCNSHKVPMEFNCANYVNKRTNLNNLYKMLKRCEQIYVNSDAHTLAEIQGLRKAGMLFLAENNYL
ncbi:MAG: hypothetical protein WC061_07565, partial [Melioribacteraceae bacterium]